AELADHGSGHQEGHHGPVALRQPAPANGGQSVALRGSSGPMRRLVVPVLIGLLALTGCKASNAVMVSAKFGDIADLTPSAPVMMNDVKVGEVKSIKLAGNEALVTMALEPSADVPQGVIARVRRTSLLGERIIDLQIPDNLSNNAPPIRNGTMITDTVVRPDLEDLVSSGNAVLAPITGSDIATLGNEGYKG